MKAINNRGFTLSEILIAGALCAAAVGLTLTVFTSALKIMYRDSKRLETNYTLRNSLAVIANETMDSSEIYLFPSYESLDGSDDILANLSTEETEDGSDFFGDCLLAVTRVSSLQAASSNVRQFRIFYRVATNPSDDGELRYYKSTDYGAETGTATSLNNLLKAVNLRANPRHAGTRLLATRAHARPRPTTGSYPIFSSSSNTVSPDPQAVAVNVEIVGSSGAHTNLSTTCFNYAISPRK